MEGSCAHGSTAMSSVLKGMSTIVSNFGSCTSDSSTHVLGHLKSPKKMREC